MTSRQLADAVGTSEQRIWLWERGRHIPRFARAVKLAAALEMPRSEIDEVAASVERALRGV